MTESLLDLIKQTEGPAVEPSTIDYRALSIRLYKALRKLLGHESIGRWTQAPFPQSKRLGCQYCEREWADHSPDCIFPRLEKFLNQVEQVLK